MLCYYEPGDLMAFFTDLGWIVSHSYTVHGALSSGSTSFLYDGSLRNKSIGKFLLTVVQHYDFKYGNRRVGIQTLVPLSRRLRFCLGLSVCWLVFCFCVCCLYVC